MAKMMEKNMDMCKCTCSPGGFFKLLLGAVMMAVGVYFLVWGLWAQWNPTYANMGWFRVMLYYAIGFLAWAMGKMMKRMAMGGCPMHGGMCMGMCMK